jgi:hypothetical protein
VKRCSKCKRLLHGMRFGCCPGHLDGLQSACKECVAKAGKAIYQRKRGQFIRL